MNEFIAPQFPSLGPRLPARERTAIKTRPAAGAMIDAVTIERTDEGWQIGLSVDEHIVCSKKWMGRLEVGDTLSVPFQVSLLV